MRQKYNPKQKHSQVVYSILGLQVLVSSITEAFSPGFSNNVSLRKSNKNVAPLQSSTDSGWGVADDWNKLTANDMENPTFDSSSIFNVDAASKAALDFEKGNAKQKENSDLSPVIKKENDFIHHAIDTIQSESIDPDGPALYDTLDSFDKYTKTVSFEDDMGKEISLLVRCNESPHELLVDGGRALPDLEDDDKYDIMQLINKKENQNTNSHTFVPSDFLVDSIHTMFMHHAKAIKKGENNAYTALDRAGVASWLSKSLDESVSQHDNRIAIVMSKYGTYGAGILREEQFMKIYVDVVMTGLDNSNKKKEKQTANLLKRMKMRQASIMDVWRDMKAHGILPPIISIREELQAKIDAEFGRNMLDNKMDSMDECEILEWKNDEHSTPRESSNSNMNGATYDIKKSSHELVEFSSDGKTPKRLRDGDFVFIDEESCIGCYQCANVSPSSFKIEDSGRARTFHQSNSPDVAIAVSACPVSCMHNVAFRELKEMETARDVGDGHTHHRHLGNPKGHTPVHIARRGSDMNHKSSWYHYLKQKCFLSKACPQKGCYDCPNYANPGDNPNFKKMHAAAESVRAKDIVDSGEADEWRNTADL